MDERDKILDLITLLTHQMPINPSLFLIDKWPYCKLFKYKYGHLKQMTICKLF